MDELAAGGELAKRIVGFGQPIMPLTTMGPMGPAGFPTRQVTNVNASAKKA